MNLNINNMKTKNLNDRSNRIIARGEFSDHAHIITGDCKIFEDNGDIFIKPSKNCAIKHLIESIFIEQGVEKWTEEHTDISLAELPAQVRHGDVFLERINKNTYKYIQQIEKDPYENVIRAVRD